MKAVHGVAAPDTIAYWHAAWDGNGKVLGWVHDGVG